MPKPNTNAAVRSVAQRLAHMKRASDKRLVNTREEEQRKYSSALQEELGRYNADPAAVIAEATWTCSYCGRVLEPRVIPLKHREGSKVIPKDRCGCLEEADFLEQERATQREPWEVYEWLAYMRRAGLVGWLAKATFDTYRPENQQQTQHKTLAQIYCDKLLAGALDKPWLIFHGDVGLGKTHLAAAILHQAMHAGWDRCWMRVWPEWLEALMATFDGEGSAPVLVNELKAGRLIVVDDIDKQHLSKRPEDSWAREKLYNVLNHRFNKRLPTILTFNHAPLAMEPWLGKPIVDRMMQVAFGVCEFTGTSFRSDIAWGENGQ